MHDHDGAHRHDAARDDPAEDEHTILERALRELLIEKGVFGADDVRREIERMERLDGSRGGEIVARAWTDAAFRDDLLGDAGTALRGLGIDLGGTVRLSVTENTAGRHHLVVCTLCSCYPRSLLGRPPAWYKSREYRARAVREPRRVLAEFGTVLPGDMQVRVVDSTADFRFMVLPRRPAGTDGWSLEALARLATRDTLIGVRCPALGGTIDSSGLPI